MRTSSKILLIGLVLGALALCVSAGWGWSDNPEDAVLLKDIHALTFHNDKYTASRRSRAVPQLKCVGGDAKNKYEPETVQCVNMGSDGTDIQWRCEADMSTDYRFGKTDVSCEGYRNKNDPYVLRGSCGLEYTLEYTDAGRARAASRHKGSYTRDSAAEATRTAPKLRTYGDVEGIEQGEGFFASARRKLGQFLLLAVILTVVGSIFCGGALKALFRTVWGTARAATTPVQPRRGLFGFWPFGAAAAAAARAHHNTGSTGGGFYPAPPTMSAPFAPSAPGYYDEKSVPTAATQSSGPGFWTGAALAGAAGYVAGRMTSNRSSDRTEDVTVRGGGGSPTAVPVRVSEPEVPPATTRTAVGFGTTKRR